jgi:chemotaxis protein methyltransferase CheR
MDEFTDIYFKKYCDLLYKRTGIFVKENKKETFKLKIAKSMRKLNIHNHDEFLQYLQKYDCKEHLQQFIYDMTTNTTEFFQEKQHFDFIEKNIRFIMKNNPRIARKNEIRIWSAASSSGQEAVSLAILLKECFDNRINIKILATDIDSEILSKAVKGIYSYSECKDIPQEFLYKYFDKVSNGFSIKEEIRCMIQYRHFNLMEDYNFKKGFDIIFCRNVMIYFSNPIQERLINKFYNNIVQGGLLFIGHSESLVSKSHKYQYIGPAIYMK